MRGLIFDSSRFSISSTTIELRVSELYNSLITLQILKITWDSLLLLLLVARRIIRSRILYDTYDVVHKVSAWP